VSPVVAALLFHAPGVRLFTKHRLSSRVLWLNAAAIGATVALTVVAGLRYGALGALSAWAFGHVCWSITLATIVHREIHSGRG